MYVKEYLSSDETFTEQPNEEMESNNDFVVDLKSCAPFQEVDHDNRHKTLRMSTSCPMGVLDALCLDDE
eukprot:1250758-Ditylum_brightwellii.AAC.1